MKETIIDSINELKRAEHMTYVSLKYSRTGDVIYNIVKRLVICLQKAMTAVFMKKKEDGEIDEVPSAPTKIALILKESNKEYLKQMGEYYLYLNQLKKSEYSSINEFRRYLTVSFETPEGIKKLDIDKTMYLFKEIKNIIIIVKRDILD